MPIRCAVAGLNRGSLFVERLANNPHCEVVAVCDRLPQKLAEHSGIAGFVDFREMLDKARPEVVAIITPGPDHGPESLAALEAGVHVLVETPNVYSVAEAEAVVTAARAGGLKYMLAEDYPYTGAALRLREIVDEGGSGRSWGRLASTLTTADAGCWRTRAAIPCRGSASASRESSRAGA